MERRLARTSQVGAGERGTRGNLSRRPGRFWRGLAFILLLVIFLAGWFGGVVYLATASGRRLRDEQARAALQVEMAHQVELAGEDLAAGRYALARSRLEWVLGQDPAYPGASTLYQQAQTQLNALLTPLPTPTLTPTSTPLPMPTRASSLADPETQLEALDDLAKTEDWRAVVTAVKAFQFDYPNYERRQTDTLLYEAYVNLGLSLLPGPQVEQGLAYLTEAEKLGDLPQEVADQRGWAELYVQGIGFYRVNWGAAVFYFRDLCLAAPFFHDACSLLYESLVAYADQLAVAQDWCPAEALYWEAQPYSQDNQLTDRLARASEGCLAATATPTPAVTPTATP